jgi:hypothetical protein
LTRYIPGELGELQKKILRHFFDCKAKPMVAESVSHISKHLGVLQPSVHRSVEILRNDKYLLKDDKYTVGEKGLVLTEKGAAAAVLLGISTDDVTSYFKKIRRKDITGQADDLVGFFNNIRQLEGIGEPSKQDLLIKKMMEYYLEKNYFDEMGGAKQLDQEDFRRLLAYIAVQYHTALGKPRSIRDVMEKYGIDKKLVTKTLEQEKSKIDSLIRELQD